MLDQERPGSENILYGTSYEGCTDRITILTSAESAAFKNRIKNLGNNWWLMTPGHDLTSAAYYSSQHEVMEYGYAVEEDKISARPVITVSLELEN